jgi:hypothetical protein
MKLCCSLEGEYQSFETTHCLYLQNSALKMAAVRSSEPSTPRALITRGYNPDGYNMNRYHHGNLKSNYFFFEESCLHNHRCKTLRSYRAPLCSKLRLQCKCTCSCERKNHTQKARSGDMFLLLGIIKSYASSNKI